MQCPIDQTTLAMTERQGIEIDYCPTCRGVWLDRGELDKLIDGADQSMPSAQTPEPPRQTYQQPQPPPQRYDDRNYRPQHNIHDSDDPSYKYAKKRKKGGFLGNIFDF